MLTARYGGSKGRRLAFHDDGDLVVVRTMRRGARHDVSPLSLQARRASAALEPLFGFPAAGVGVWKARFSFKPIRQGEIGGAEFASWTSATKYVTNSPDTQRWAVENAPDINSKRTQYWPEWNSKPPHQRDSQTLTSHDGSATVR